MSVPESIASRRRAQLVVVGVVLAGLVAWTLLILVTPVLRFNVAWPSARLPLETARLVVATLAAALAYMRFSISRSGTYLFIALAFVVLVANQFAFGVVLQSSIVELDEGAYLWTVGRLLTGAMLLAGASSWGSREIRSERPLRVFLGAAAGSVALLSAIQIPLWLLREDLPPLAASDVPLDQVSGILPGLTAVNLGLGLVGASVFLLAAFLYLRLERPAFAGWLPVALVLAAFSHVHYMLMPTVFGDRLSTGDVLRLAFSGVLLIGLVSDVRATYLAERERQRELTLAYEAERQRVRDLEASDRSRAELLGMLTHELLHPVAATRTLVVALLKRWGDLDDEARRELVGRIDAQTRHLVTLAERVPDVSASTEEAFRLLLEEREVGALVHEALAMSTDRRRIELAIPEEVARTRIMVDPVRLLEVFRNLLSNAAKFSPDGSPILIGVTRTGPDLVFHVKDRGGGVAPEETERVFGPFVRGAAAAREGVPGAGLGLYVSKRIVEGHGGRIWVESDQERGATFSFSLPLDRERAGSA